MITKSYLIGLIFLLLLAPCKVRNYIQAELGLQTTEVSNKSQANLSNSTCETLEETKVTTSASKSYDQVLFVSVSNSISFPFRIIDFNTKSAPFYTKEINTSSFVPLYILFKNFKAHL